MAIVASAAVASAQSTAFLQWDRRFHSNGAWTVQKFTLSAKRNLVLRVASDWKADVAVIPSSQLNRFKNGQSFSGYFALRFDMFLSVVPRSIATAPALCAKHPSRPHWTAKKFKFFWLKKVIRITQQ